MILKNVTVEQTTMTEYTFLEIDGNVLYYKEWTNDSGKVIDCVLRDRYGDLEDPIMIEKIQNIVDEIEAKNVWGNG